MRLVRFMRTARNARSCLIRRTLSGSMFGTTIDITGVLAASEIFTHDSTWFGIKRIARGTLTVLSATKISFLSMNSFRYVITLCDSAMLLEAC